MQEPTRFGDKYLVVEHKPLEDMKASEVRIIATGMPFRSEARKVQMIAWIRQYMPDRDPMTQPAPKAKKLLSNEAEKHDYEGDPDRKPHAMSSAPPCVICGENENSYAHR